MKSSMKRDLLTLKDFSKQELLDLFDRTLELKRLDRLGQCPQPLAGKTLGLLMEKSSTRTRVSFEVGMFKLGGYTVYLNQSVSQLGRGESYADTARVLSRYVDVIVLRTFSQQHLTELAAAATVPVINGLTDSFHPCQLLADLVTIRENKKNFEKMVVSYVGDGNNMTHSWMMAAAVLGFELRVATPKGYEVDPEIKALMGNARIVYSHDARMAVSGCDVINTDTWFSMGQEVSDEKRNAFWPFQVNNELVKMAKKDAIVLHCLPAHRGEEITDEVLDGPQSVVFDEAENRLYAQMALLEKLVLLSKK